jgi:hypothetical protein
MFSMFPDLWPELFPGLFPGPEAFGARAAANACSPIAAPFRAVFALPLSLQFAAQGAGRMIWTVAAGFARMRGAAGGAVILSGLDGAGISSIFAAGIASHGPLIAAWPRMSGLRRATSRREAAHSVT